MELGIKAATHGRETSADTNITIFTQLFTAPITFLLSSSFSLNQHKPNLPQFVFLWRSSFTFLFQSLQKWSPRSFLQQIWYRLQVICACAISRVLVIRDPFVLTDKCLNVKYLLSCVMENLWLKKPSKRQRAN